MTAIPPVTTQAAYLTEGASRRQIKAELAEFLAIKKAYHLDDSTSQDIEEWVHDFLEALAHTSDDKMLLEAFAPRLRQRLIVRATQEPILDEAFLASNGRTYSKAVLQRQTPPAHLKFAPHPLANHALAFLRAKNHLGPPAPTEQQIRQERTEAIVQEIGQRTLVPPAPLRRASESRLFALEQRVLATTARLNALRTDQRTFVTEFTRAVQEQEQDRHHLRENIARDQARRDAQLDQMDVEVDELDRDTELLKQEAGAAKDAHIRLQILLKENDRKRAKRNRLEFKDICIAAAIVIGSIALSQGAVLATPMTQGSAGGYLAAIPTLYF